jgi:hypothetical protein
MRIEKEKRRVRIACKDNTAITGFIHINPGERVMDFLNRSKKDFIVVTEAVLKSSGGKSENTFCLNKSAVKWIEEL